MANRNAFITVLTLGISLNLIASTSVPPFYNTQFISYGQRQNGKHVDSLEKLFQRLIGTILAIIFFVTQVIAC